MLDVECWTLCKSICFGILEIFKNLEKKEMDIWMLIFQLVWLLYEKKCQNTSLKMFTNFYYKFQWNKMEIIVTNAHVRDWNSKLMSVILNDISNYHFCSCYRKWIVHTVKKL